MPSADLPDFCPGDNSDFYTGKVMQATYFVDVTIPALMARLEIAGKPGREVVEIPDSAL